MLICIAGGDLTSILGWLIGMWLIRNEVEIPEVLWYNVQNSKPLRRELLEWTFFMTDLYTCFPSTSSLLQGLRTTASAESISTLDKLARWLSSPGQV